MAAVGEVSAIVALVATAAQLSKAIVGTVINIKDAKGQIESFGREVGILGTVLDSVHSASQCSNDSDVQQVITKIVNEGRMSSAVSTIPAPSSLADILLSGRETISARLHRHEEEPIQDGPDDHGDRCLSSVSTARSDASGQSILSSIIRLYHRGRPSSQLSELSIPAFPGHDTSPNDTSQGLHLQRSTSIDPHQPLRSHQPTKVRKMPKNIDCQEFVEIPLLYNNVRRILEKAEATYERCSEISIQRVLLGRLCCALLAVEQKIHDHHIRQLQCLDLLRLVKLCEKIINQLMYPTRMRRRHKWITDSLNTLEQSILMIGHVLATSDDEQSGALLRSDSKIWPALNAARLVYVQPGVFFYPNFWAKEHLDHMMESESAKKGNIMIPPSRAYPFRSALNRVEATSDLPRKSRPLTDADIRNAVMRHAPDCIKCRGLSLGKDEEITSLISWHEHTLCFKRPVFGPSQLEVRYKMRDPDDPYCTYIKELPQ
ncbi:MAG: hypothetical protein Q9220_002654 [cf. Caloplaca sp. 1 TL-2023]